MRLLGIVNPRAGGGRPLRRLPTLRRALEHSPHDVEWFVASSIAETHRRICEAPNRGMDGVILVGGDGTVHEALPALREAGLPFGVVPCGRGNDFARNVGISRRRAETMWCNEAPEVCRVDLPMVNGSPFASVACLGFDAMVNRLARDGAGYFGGTLGYVVCVLRALGAFEPFEVEVVVERWRWSGSIMLVAVANGPCYGGGMRIAPQASMHDGRLDVCIVRAVPKTTLLREFPKVFRGRHTSHPAFITAAGRSVTVTAEGDRELFADGECMGRTPAEVTVEAQALRVLLPSSSAVT